MIFPRRSPRRSRCSRCRAPDRWRLGGAARGAAAQLNGMLFTAILVPAVLNGLMTGAVYALIALGLTLIYGVLHIINFAHGALLTAALFAAFFAHQCCSGSIPTSRCSSHAAVLPARLRPAALRHRPGRHGEDRNILLVTLGLAVVIENALLYAFRADTRTHQPALRLRRDRGRHRRSSPFRASSPSPWS